MFKKSGLGLVFACWPLKGNAWSGPPWYLHRASVCTWLVAALYSAWWKWRNPSHWQVKKGHRLTIQTTEKLAMLITCFASTVPAGLVRSATNISSRTESESLTQEETLLPKQQHPLCHSDAAYHHYTHLSLYLQKDKRETECYIKPHAGGTIRISTFLSRDMTWHQRRHSRLYLIDHFNHIF